MNEIKKNDEQPNTKEQKTIQAGIGRKTTWDKLKDSFINEDNKSVGDYVVFDVLVPAVKKTMVDMVTTFINTLFYGSGRAPQGQGGYPNGQVSYNRYYQQSAPPRTYDTRYSTPANNSRLTVFDYRYLNWPSKDQADFVLNQLRDILITYSIVRVSDVFDLGGQQCPYTAERYGWTNLMNAQSYRGQDGLWYLDLPKAMPID